MRRKFCRGALWKICRHNNTTTYVTEHAARYSLHLEMLEKYSHISNIQYKIMCVRLSQEIIY